MERRAAVDAPVRPQQCRPHRSDAGAWLIATVQRHWAGDRLCCWPAARQAALRGGASHAPASGVGQIAGTYGNASRPPTRRRDTPAMPRARPPHTPTGHHGAVGDVGTCHETPPAWPTGEPDGCRSTACKAVRFSDAPWPARTATRSVPGLSRDRNSTWSKSARAKRTGRPHVAACEHIALPAEVEAAVLVPARPQRNRAVLGGAGVSVHD
jgi:hypothetical protein